MNAEPCDIHSEDTPFRPDGKAVYGEESDTSAGGADSSPWEAEPSGEKAEAARERQDQARENSEVARGD